MEKEKNTEAQRTRRSVSHSLLCDLCSSVFQFVFVSVFSIRMLCLQRDACTRQGTKNGDWLGLDICARMQFSGPQFLFASMVANELPETHATPFLASGRATRPHFEFIETARPLERCLFQRDSLLRILFTALGATRPANNRETHGTETTEEYFQLSLRDLFSLYVESNRVTWSD
jgi:hypothetical protein